MLLPANSQQQAKLEWSRLSLHVCQVRQLTRLWVWNKPALPDSA